MNWTVVVAAYGVAETAAARKATVRAMMDCILMDLCGWLILRGRCSGSEVKRKVCWKCFIVGIGSKKAADDC